LSDFIDRRGNIAEQTVRKMWPGIYPGHD